ncbi:MAG: hypothetical protein QM811_02705 [Pirellulales bacterium]
MRTLPFVLIVVACTTWSGAADAQERVLRQAKLDARRTVIVTERHTSAAENKRYNDSTPNFDFPGESPAVKPDPSSIGYLYTWSLHEEGTEPDLPIRRIACYSANGPCQYYDIQDLRVIDGAVITLYRYNQPFAVVFPLDHPEKLTNRLLRSEPISDRSDRGTQARRQDGGSQSPGLQKFDPDGRVDQLHQTRHGPRSPSRRQTGSGFVEVKLAGNVLNV